MAREADLVQAMLSPDDVPSDRWCDSGHQAPKVFRRGGHLSEALPTRFFRVIGHGLDGIYCEPCLIIAGWMGHRKRKERKLAEIAEKVKRDASD